MASRPPSNVFAPEIHSNPSCPGLTRAPTPFHRISINELKNMVLLGGSRVSDGVDGRVKPGHDHAGIGAQRCAGVFQQIAGKTNG